ncbi:MAG: hypothetical protein U0Q18_25415 [Bryobacteraceae bacterium]
MGASPIGGLRAALSGTSPAVIDHPALGVVSYEITPVSPDPTVQVAQTIDLMRRYTLEDLQAPGIQSDAAACATLAPDPVLSAWDWCKKDGAKGLRFTRDENLSRPLWLGGDEAIEVLVRPQDMARLANPQGDCDCFSMYTAAMLLSLGVPCSFATIAANPEIPHLFTHVYCVAYPDGERVPMDTSHGPYPGWESPVCFRMEEWPLGAGAIAPGPGNLLLAAAAAYVLWKGLRRYFT